MIEKARRRPRLLVVDDVFANREMLARRFELRGFEALQADGGLRALELIEEHDLDVVLLDVMMPDIDGREVLRRIRERRSASELPVIMVTARSETADVVEALSLGANDYLTKPVDFTLAWARVDAQIGRKRAQEEARATEERLRAAQKLEAVGQLAGGIAHDFNNLLLVIDGYSRMALRSSDDPAAVVSHLGEVLRATEAAEALINQLSVFSRRELVDRKIVRAADVLAETVRFLRPLFQAHQSLTLEIAPDAAELCLDTDPAELKHAIVNLALNARDALPSGGVIVLGLDRVDGETPQAEIRVQDGGVGMDEETRARVFEPFFTTKAHGVGTGLGLAMVYGFAQQSGGEVSVESELGAGSTFRLRLPSVEHRPAPCLITVDASARGAGETILIVDDNDQLSGLMQSTLKELGYRVLYAGNGVEALEVEAEHGDAVDLVLSDIVMPALGGFELAQILRRTRPDLPVVFMSGYPTRGELKSVSVPEGAAFLAKPFKPFDLARTVRAALDARHRGGVGAAA